jgi:hypothetical protein
MSCPLDERMKRQPQTWISTEDACLGDQLCSLFVRRSAYAPWISGLIGLLTGLLLFVPGFFVSNVSAPGSKSFLKLTDPRDWPLAGYYNLFYVPFIWFCYVWQPKAIAELLYRLHGEGSIDYSPRVQTRRLVLYVFRPLTTIFLLLSSALSKASLIRKGFLSLVLVTLFVIGWLANTQYYTLQCQVGPNCYGEQSHWVYQNESYFYFVWCPLAVLPLLFAVIIALRQLVLAIEVSKLFRIFRVHPKLFHPDKCAGLSFVGTYALKSAAIAVVVGFTLILLLQYPVWVGTDFRLDWLLLTFLILFLFFAPLFFLTPIWSVHRALENIKVDMIQPYSKEINHLIDGASSSNTVPLRDVLERFELAKSIDDAFGTVPLPRLTGIAFVVVYVTPILIGVFSLLK